MNTIKSNLQFFHRAKARFGNKICVFNSREKKKDQNPEFRHAKDVTGVKKHLLTGCNVVIMCAHPKRFDSCIIDLVTEIADSRKIRKQVIIHIDEAHAYVPAWRTKVIQMNDAEVTERIYMYSATPFAIWTKEGTTTDEEQLFENIFVVDCQKDFGVSTTDKYFGVKDCPVVVVPRTTWHKRVVGPIISGDFIRRYGNDKQVNIVRGGGEIHWYGTGSSGAPFSLGDEVEFLSHTGYTMRQLKKSGRIKCEEFSYNFVPAFQRKLTHYAIMEEIIKTFPTALVVIINGDGTKLYRLEDELPIGEFISHKDEPSEQIEECMSCYPGRPIFITGFHCVGMSVTFINPRIGNFDNVIYSHEQYKNSPDILYQMCRFLFNFTGWEDSDILNIKKTRIYVTSQGLINSCLDYEKQIDKISGEMTGSLRTMGEVVGNLKVKQKKIPKGSKFDGLIDYMDVTVKKVTVDGEEDEQEVLEKVMKIYKDWTGNDLKGKAMPKKETDGIDVGLYQCSTTRAKEVFTGPTDFRKTLNGWKPTSNFELIPNKYKYARVYVVYEDKEYPHEYTWFIRMMSLTRCEEVDSFFAPKSK